MFNNKSILITGGTGFFGNYFVNYLRNQWVMGEKNRPAPVEVKKEEEDNINRDYL